jgi:hypothetical protein
MQHTGGLIIAKARCMLLQSLADKSTVCLSKHVVSLYSYLLCSCLQHVLNGRHAHYAWLLAALRSSRGRSQPGISKLAMLFRSLGRSMAWFAALTLVSYCLLDGRWQLKCLSVVIISC